MFVCVIKSELVCHTVHPNKTCRRNKAAAHTTKESGDSLGSHDTVISSLTQCYPSSCCYGVDLIKTGVEAKVQNVFFLHISWDPLDPFKCVLSGFSRTVKSVIEKSVFARTCMIESFDKRIPSV